MPNLQCPICGRRIRKLEDHIARFHPEDSSKSKQPNVSKYRTNKQTIGQKKERIRSDDNKTIIIVDGMNVANYGSLKRPSYKNLFVIYKYLKELGYKPKIIISAALKYKIDDAVRLNKMLNRGIAIEAASGEDDDLTVMEFARRYKAKIITNDRFLDHPEKDEWQLEMINFSIFDRQVIFQPHL
jgi:hypothetical protein